MDIQVKQSKYTSSSNILNMTAENIKQAIYKFVGTIKELYKDKIAGIYLYGSVARNEEQANSDIDLMVITREKHCQKRHVVRHGITVEFLEMHLMFAGNFIAENEIPVLFTLAQGVLLFSKFPETEKLIAKARRVLANGPSVNPKWENERYAIKRRSDLTEIYKDLLDIEDEIAFHYIISRLITEAIPMLNENYSLWPRTRKKTMPYLKEQCPEGYEHIETLLSPLCSLPEKRDAAKDLINFALKKHGGILEGDAVIFKFDHI